MGDRKWRAAARSYLSSRVARHALARQSRRGYAYVLHDLADELDERDIPAGIGPVAMAGVVDDWLAGRAWSAATICTNLGIIRPWLDWMATHKLIQPGASALLRNPRKPKGIPRAQTARAVAQLLAHVPDARGRAIVLLEAQAGLRRAEVAAVDMVDLDLFGGSLLVHGKGSKERVAYLSEETMDAIRQWLVERGSGPGALISSYEHPGRALTPTWVGMLVARWMRDAGLKTMPRDGVSGHALRHTAATSMLRAGANIRVVQEAMGHSDITTTARYLRADDAEVRAAMAGLSYGSRRLRTVPTVPTTTEAG